MTRLRKHGINENKRNRSNRTQIALQQLLTAVRESDSRATMSDLLSALTTPAATVLTLLGSALMARLKSRAWNHCLGMAKGMVTLNKVPVSFLSSRRIVPP
jgi:hypothetical protein